MSRGMRTYGRYQMRWNTPMTPRYSLWRWNLFRHSSSLVLILDILILIIGAYVLITLFFVAWLYITALVVLLAIRFMIRPGTGRIW